MQRRPVTCTHASGAVPDEPLSFQHDLLRLAVIVFHCVLATLWRVRRDLALVINNDTQTGTQPSECHLSHIDQAGMAQYVLHNPVKTYHRCNVGTFAINITLAGTSSSSLPHTDH